MLKRLIIITCFYCFFFIFNSCQKSIFPSPEDSRKNTAQGNISLGNEEKNKRNFEKARSYYKKATELDPTLSDGWYLKAEMELRVEGIILPHLINELQNDNTKKLPFFPDSSIDGNLVIRDTIVNYSSTPDTFEVTPLDTMYDRLVFLFNPCVKAYNDLLHIFKGEATNGTFTKDKILLDFTMLSSLHTALLSLDNIPKDSALSKKYGSSNQERKLYKIMGSSLKNIDSIEINIDSVKSLFEGPEDINQMLDDLINSAGVSLNSITDLDDDIKNSTSDNIDKDMLDDPKVQMQNIITKANFYYYNDLKNNDNDYYDSNNDNQVQRTIHIDINGNNKIDWWDSQGDTVCISDTLKTIRENPSYSYNTNLFGIDTSDTSNTYYFFKGQNGGEFVAGDWGIDEEQLDNFDNDGDGIKDEDSRIVSDTIDQDTDFVDIDTLTAHKSGRVNPFNPSENMTMLIWVDTITVDGKISAPDGTPITKNYVLDNIDAIKDSINNGKCFGEWIQGDWGVDEEYVDGLDNDGDGKIDEDGDIHKIHHLPYDKRIEILNYIKNNINIDNITITEQ